MAQTLAPKICSLSKIWFLGFESATGRRKRKSRKTEHFVLLEQASKIDPPKIRKIVKQTTSWPFAKSISFYADPWPYLQPFAKSVSFCVRCCSPPCRHLLNPAVLTWSPDRTCRHLLNPSVFAFRKCQWSPETEKSSN